MSRSSLNTLAALGTGLALLLGTSAASAARFQITNLVSDGSVSAVTIDPLLVNPWGIASSPTGPFWSANNHTDTSTLYNTGGAKIPLTVTVAGGAPTGIVFSGGADFVVSANSKSGPSRFIFDSENGIISGWNFGVNATNTVIKVDNSASGAVYKGLAIGSSSGVNYIYAANFNSGQVEQYDGNFALVRTFTDPTVAAGYAPFNVQTIGNHLFVTFALQNAEKHDDVRGAGHGYIDEFNLDGTFVQRLVSLGGPVNSPWGLTIAPASFGVFAGDLLVGNFGDGTIGAFDITTGAFEGDLLGINAKPLVIGDLWGLINGNGGAGGLTSNVYFAAGVQDEAQGLFGAISAVPEPATLALGVLGAAMTGAVLRRRRAIG